jgi:hypothetical protein
VDAGREEPWIVASLDPLHEVVTSGVSYADRLRSAWPMSPAEFIRTHRVPAPPAS